MVHTTRGRVARMVLNLTIVTASVSACTFELDEKPCSDGSFPVTAKGGGPGSTCVRSGDPVPDAYETFPAGQTPTTYPYDTPSPSTP